MSETMRTRTATCCICSKKFPRICMTYVPTVEKTLSKWFELLDDTFRKNWEDTQSAKMVCKSHFICTHNGKVMPGALPRTEEYTHYMEKLRRTLKEPIMLDTLCLDVYGLHSYSNISRRVKTGQYVLKDHIIVTCCICSKTLARCNMENVPDGEKTLELWMELLGEPFSENFKKNPPPHMVCKSHFIRTHDGKVVTGALPRTEDYHHIMEKPKRWNWSSKHMDLDDLSWDVYGLHSYARISREINSGPYVINTFTGDDYKNKAVNPNIVTVREYINAMNKIN